jgi:hypothetical protein
MAFIGKNSVTVTSLDSAESMSVVTDLTVDTNTLKVDSVSNRVGILNATPSVSLDIGTATDAIHIPVGTTGERPGSPTSGLFRYNTSLNQFEGYTSTWGAIGGGGTNTFTHDSFTGDNSTTDFVLSQATESENNLFVFIDGVFQTQDAYSIATNSGITTLTLSAAPAQDRKIIVYTVAAGVSGNNLNQNLFDANTSDAVDGVNDTFTLSIPPVNKNNTQVFFDGVYQHKANYSVSGTSLTFTDAPPLGVVVEVMIFTQTAVNVPVDNSVTSSKLSGDLVAPGNLTVTGYLAGPSTFILDPSAVGDNTGTLLVKGNLQVDGTQTIINSTTLTVDDLNITLASGAANALAADGAGITIDTGSDPDATITYDGVNDRWNFNKNVDVTGTVTADGLTVDGDGSFVTSDGAILKLENSTTAMTSNDVIGELQFYANDGSTNGTGAKVNIIAKTTSAAGSIADLTFGTSGSTSATALPRLNIAGNGDISFYEDTGVSQSFFWDASAESLGIGTSSPTSLGGGAKLTVNQAADGNIVFARGGSTRQVQLGTTSTTGYINADNTSGGLTFNVNASERMRIDTSGNVGIGTASPATKLHVENDASTYEIMRVGSSTVTHDTGLYMRTTGTAGISWGTGGVLAFYGSGAGSAERMRIDASGNVGIGTSSVNGKLDIKTSSAGFEFYPENSTDTNLIINFDRATSTYQNLQVRAATHQFLISDSEKMRIDASGNVGIGTTPSTDWSANSVLQIGTKASFSSSSSFSGFSTNLVALSSGWSVKYTSAGAASAYLQATSDGSHRFYTAPSGSAGATATLTERMRLDADGNVNIYGTDNRPLAITSFATASAGAGWDLDATSISGVVTVSTGGTERMRIDASGHAIIPAGVTLGTAVGTYNAANTLDDYEEGTFTPQFNITNATITHDIEQGNYTKVGNTVFFHIVIGTDAASGSFSGSNVLITGMPFAASRSQTGAIGLTHSWASELDDPAWSISAGTTTMSFYKADNAAGLVLGAQFATGGNSNRLDITGCYHTDS